MSSRSVVTGLLALGVACTRGGGGGEASSLNVTPETAVVTAGGPGVTLHAQASGDVDVITWSIAGPGSLTASQGDTTAYVPPERVAAEELVVVTARMGSASDAAEITVEAAPGFVLRGREATRLRGASRGAPCEGATTTSVLSAITGAGPRGACGSIGSGAAGAGCTRTGSLRSPSLVGGDGAGSASRARSVGHQVPASVSLG